MDRLLLVDLPVFLQVARHGSMTKAAEALRTVQSNVTARIKRLEEHLGTTLIVRSPRKLRLTPEGEALMPFALRLEELCRDVQSHFANDDRPQGGSLRIGAIETFAASHLVGLIARFTARNPAVDVSVQTGGNQFPLAESSRFGTRCGVCVPASERPGIFRGESLRGQAGGHRAQRLCGHWRISPNPRMPG